MLSNTATPKYYGEFRRKVMSGEIPICKEISMEMNRIDALIEDPRYYYDDNAIEGFIRYCECELTLTDGSEVVLLDSFKLWAEQLLSWYYFSEAEVFHPSENGGGRYVKTRVKKRLTNKQYLIVARGAAKSMYASFIQAYFLNVDPTTTYQVVTAPTMRQAEEIMSPIRTAITRSRGDMFKFLTSPNIRSNNKSYKANLASTKQGIENFLTNSLIEVRPMSVDKLQGLRNKISTVDEWLSGDTREDVISALEQGGSKGFVEDYIILAVSSEGTVRNGIGDSIKMELAQILKGEYNAPHISIWHYKLDDVQEVGQPDLWIKSNPNLGKTVSYETYQKDVERAESNPSTRNDILAKRFGIPMEGYTYFFTYEETLPHSKQNFWSLPCSLGADLSQGDDFCAFTFLFPLDGFRFGVKARSYITERTYTKLSPAALVKYNQFVEEGSLVIMEGTILNMMDVYDDLDNHIVDMEYDVRTFGFDPYNAKEFVERFARENGVYGVEKVIQGAKTESVPLGELKKLSEDRVLLFDEQIMSYAMGNCIVIEDTNGNRKLLKARREDKIDNVAALMDAFVAYSRNTEAFD